MRLHGKTEHQHGLERIADMRKEKDWSQTDLANESSVSREMIDKYERGEASPSIEAAKKIADAFGVSLDYLVGEGTNAAFDKATLKRLQDLQKLSTEDRIMSMLCSMHFYLNATFRKTWQ